MCRSFFRVVGSLISMRLEMLNSFLLVVDVIVTFEWYIVMKYKPNRFAYNFAHSNRIQVG
jgi:hypothetical protein